MLNLVIEKISAQQKGKEDTALFMVGEQLKDICRDTPGAAELVLQDLDVPEMSLEKCEAKIKAYADELHDKNKGGCICISPSTAEKIIRKFYGIGEKQEKTSSNIVSLTDLM